jgi:hypothetical protein
LLQAADKAREYFKNSPNVTVVDDIPIDDGWTRDWGPTVRLCLSCPCCLLSLPLYRPCVLQW